MKILKQVFFIFRDKEKKFLLINELSQLFFLGKLFMIYESYDLNFKLAILNILSKVIRHPLVNENFQKMKGFAIVFNEMRNNSNQKVKILTLHCLNELIQNPGNFLYFKAPGIIDYLQESLRFIIIF